MMLTTPFGRIKIIADGHEIAYEAIPYNSTVKSIKLQPLTGSFRIIVPAWAYHEIRCVVDWNCTSIENTGASGERYRDAQFIRESTILTIGVEDENPAFDTERYPAGVGYILHERVESVTFGVAWADDYTDGDVRTWLAADPSAPLPEKIQLILSQDEALVLEDWLNRIEKTMPEESAERYVAWNLECQLEKVLGSETYENYPQKLKKARENVKKHY